MTCRRMLPIMSSRFCNLAVALMDGGTRCVCAECIGDGTQLSFVADFDAAAQLLEDSLASHEGALKQLVTEQLTCDGELPMEMKNRLRLLLGIPFRGILTTNFDTLLPGTTPFDGPKAFRDFLRPYSNEDQFCLLLLLLCVCTSQPRSLASPFHCHCGVCVSVLFCLWMCVCVCFHADSMT